MDDEETLNLQTNKVKIVKLNKVRKFKASPSKRKDVKSVIYVIDTLISVTVVGPLVVGFWRGSLELLEIYAHVFPCLLSYVFAVVLHVCIVLARQFVREYVETNRKKVKTDTKFVALRRIHSYVYTMITLMQWRGSWMLFGVLNELPNKKYELISTVILLVSSILCLAFMRSLRNVVAPPFVVIMDTSDSSYNFPTRFNVPMSEKTWLYVLDCLFSVLVVGTLVVFVWRGAWVLLDDFIFPENFPTSATTSLIIGYAAVAIAFALQPLMRWVCDRLTGIPRLIAADIFLVFSLFGTVNVWRGIWNLLNIYFLPNNLELSCWITHWVCLILLILLGCSNSLLVRGVYIDAEEPAGKCVIFPCYYLRLIFQQERAKKLARRLQLEVLAKRKQDVDNNLDASNHVAQIKQIDYNCVV